MVKTGAWALRILDATSYNNHIQVFMGKRFFSTPYKFILILIFLCNGHLISYGQDTSRLQISIITCEPGSELYSIFGHSAIRVIDSNFVADVIYNFGTFDFDDPDFYQKFVQGKLKYFLSVNRAEDFISSYQAENRGVTEQVLLLSATEKRQIRDALAENMKEENRFYLYDFFLDNCTTRLRDILKKYKQPPINLPAVMPTEFTFRNAIHQYLDSGQMYWSKLGIDLLLGAPTDAVMTVEQQQFLPENLMIAIDRNASGNIVKATNPIYTSIKTDAASFIVTPMMCSALLLLIGVLLTFLSIVKKKLFFGLTFFDTIFFLLIGFLGCLFVFMWFGTDHIMTKQNYNLLWALPTHIIGAVFIRRKSNLAKSYFLGTAIISLLSLLFWSLLPQQLNTALIPIVVLIAIRSAHLFYTKRNLLFNGNQEM